MQVENFIVREPLLNARERVLGYALSWQRNRAAVPMSDADVQALIECVAAQMGDTGTDSLLGDHLLFLPATPRLLIEQAFSGLPKKRVVLQVQASDIENADVAAAVSQLRAHGYGISLCGADPAMASAGLPDFVTHVEMPGATADMADRAAAYRTDKRPSLHLIARDVADWQQYDLCASHGMDAFVGNLHLTQRHGDERHELNPAQTMIIEMMDMVRAGADVRELEGVLKRDAALSYKLLRYINSAGFGLGCEVHSLRHAVTLLGYSPLYRWLALLMATATTTGYPPVLMQAAVIRGRFAELLATGFLPKGEAENLFVAGMFSLLDRLLGIPMEEVLEKIQLSGPVSEALLSRGGIYGPFIALAEACELNTLDIGSIAGSLCISAEHVNRAHLSALAWAQILHL